MRRYTKKGSVNSNWLKVPSNIETLLKLTPELDTFSPSNLQRLSYLSSGKDLDDVICPICRVKVVPFKLESGTYKPKAYCSAQCRDDDGKARTRHSSKFISKDIIKARTEKMKATKNSEEWKLRSLVLEHSIDLDTVLDITHWLAPDIPPSIRVEIYNQQKTKQDFLCLWCKEKVVTIHNKALKRDKYCSSACSLKATREARASTNLERYGATSFFGSVEFRKVRGLQPNPMLSEKVKELRKKRSIVKWGSSHHKSSPEFDNSTPVKKAWLKRNPNLLLLAPEMIKEYKEDDGTYNLKRAEEELGIKANTIQSRLAEEHNFLASPTTPRTTQRSIFDRVVELLPDTEVAYNDKTVLKPLELDILIKEKNLALEYHGIEFHSFGVSEHSMFDNFHLLKEKKGNHLRKNLLALESGLQLLEIFSFEWLDESKRSIWESVIEGKLGLHTRVGARQCSVVEVSSSEASQFLNSHHLQGSVPAKWSFGLKYNDELVSLMTFGASRFKRDELELLRFCTKKNLTVVGGASRLLKRARDVIDVDKPIISFANRRWSNGNMYKALGFEEVKGDKPAPTYYYYKGGKVFNRLQYQKHKLEDKLEVFDKSLSEMENMVLNGFRVFFDSGQMKFVLE